MIPAVGEKPLIGIFHPPLNVAGGAEYVAINIINTLKKHGHQVAVLTGEKLNLKKIFNRYAERVFFDNEIIFPYKLVPNFFPLSELRLYLNMLSLIVSRYKCNLIIDTYTNLAFPWADVTYFHSCSRSLYELKKKRLSYLFNFPYISFGTRTEIGDQKLLIANSKSTAQSMVEKIGFEPIVLYPPVQTTYLKKSTFGNCRKDRVVSVSRFVPGKRLEIIPQIAKLVKEATFVIVGAKCDNNTLYNTLKTIRKLGLQQRVKIQTDVTRDQLKRILWNSKIYLHTRIGEPFGISIVEAMASGCIPVVHDSGGPTEFVPKNLRYKTQEDAAEIIEKGINDWSANYAERVSKIATKFNSERFAESFMRILDKSGLL